MPKRPTSPILFDECRNITIGLLKKRRFLLDGHITKGSVEWKTNNDDTSSIDLIALMDDNPRIVLDYQCNGQPIRDTIKLTYLPSNLGKGRICYFVCPSTGTRCSKLYLIESHFVHRSTLPSGMYRCQTRSKKWRQMENSYGAYFDMDNIHTVLNQKYFKKFYNGRPTKKYSKLMKIIGQAEMISKEDIIKIIDGL